MPLYSLSQASVVNMAVRSVQLSPEELLGGPGRV